MRSDSRGHGRVSGVQAVSGVVLGENFDPSW